MKSVARLMAMAAVAGLASCQMDETVPKHARVPATNPVAAVGDANVPPPGTTGNAANIPFIGGEVEAGSGKPVRLARRTGHVSNYDEAKVASYTLPDVLVTKNGKRVTSPQQWVSQRRPEILKDYQEQIYGKIPATAPKVKWEVTSTDDTAQDGTAIMKRVVGTMSDKADAPKINMTLWIPKSATGPVPVMLAINFGGGAPAAGRGRGAATAPAQQAAAPATAPGRGRGPGGAGGPNMEFLGNGWAYAAINNGDIQADNLAGLTSGVIGLSFAPGQTERKPEEWGSISAWAWGISRCVDYFETDKAINAKQVSLTGASRLGKTVLWACANDERIAGTCSIVSGEMGAALIRRDWGESLDDMTQNYPWQFAGNLQKYVGRWDDLPIDNHMLVALCAPRMVYVNGGLKDQWSDPRGEYLSMVGAGPVYRLLGKKDLGPKEYEIDKPMIEGDMGFLYHSGGHQSVPADWVAYRTFADRHFKAQGTK